MSEKNIFYAGRNAIKEKSKNTMKSVLNKTPNHSKSILSGFDRTVYVKGTPNKRAIGNKISPYTRRIKTAKRA